jgi:predicted ATP-dependent serine protease
MPLICKICGKEKPDIIYSTADEKPIGRCEACHFTMLIELEQKKSPEEEAELKTKRLAALKKAREAAKAKREAKKEVQLGKRETA